MRKGGGGRRKDGRVVEPVDEGRLARRVVADQKTSHAVTRRSHACCMITDRLGHCLCESILGSKGWEEGGLVRDVRWRRAGDGDSSS
jgi:hypothetical protein